MSCLYKSTCSHAHIWSKKCPFFRKHGSLMSFFQILRKTNVVMPIFGQKSVNSVKTTLDYGPKKSIGCLFPDFYKKSLLSLPYFVKKTSILGKQPTVMPIISQKT